MKPRILLTGKTGQIGAELQRLLPHLGEVIAPEGEEAIRKSGVPHLIFRTTWVYSTRGRNFLLSILRLATQRTELRVVSDQVGAPTSSHAVASATSTILAKLYGRGTGLASLMEASGTYHMTAAGKTNWYEFAKAILEEASGMSPNVPWFKAATNGRLLMARRVIPVSTREYPALAVRPGYSVLSNARLAQTFSCVLPDWRTQLRLVFSEGDPSTRS